MASTLIQLVQQLEQLVEGRARRTGSITNGNTEFLHNVITNKNRLSVKGTTISTEWEDEGVLRAIVLRYIDQFSHANWRETLSENVSEKAEKYIRDHMAAWHYGVAREHSRIIIVTDDSYESSIPVFVKANVSDGLRNDDNPVKDYLKAMLTAWYVHAPRVKSSWANVTFFHRESDSHLTLRDASFADAVRAFEEFSISVSNFVTCEQKD